MDFWSSLGGMVQLELCSADPAGAVTALGKQGVMVYQAEYLDTLRLRFLIPRKQRKTVFYLAEKRGDTVKEVGHFGLYHTITGLRKRPVLVLGMLLVLFLSCWVPGRVFFVRVEGNMSVPQQLIAEKAADCGIGFGASRRAVRSEKVKNALLEAMSQLQWAGVNTYGCTAVITVRERSEESQKPEETGVCSIVASRDAVIDSITVLQGNALCKPGQAVKAGQVLVSGYQDCGICIRALTAKAEIFGRTQRRCAAIFPAEYALRQQNSGWSKKYSLILGKKRINFFKGSGISGTTCAKIYEEKYITLPGGFVLPIGLSVEMQAAYECRMETVSADEAFLQNFLRQYVEQTMTAGRICDGVEICSDAAGAVRIDGVYACYEWIGLTRPEESLSE